MAAGNDLLKAFREYGDLCHEICIGGLDFVSSYWEENINAMKKQVEFWTIIDMDFKKNIDRIFEKMPFKIMKKEYIWNGDAKIVNRSLENLLEARMDYMSYLTSISNTIAKEQLNAMKKNTENGFSIFGEYLKLLSG